jgi:hypothetical protein
MKKIGTIKQEEKACRKAFADYPNATMAWCCHHDVWLEPLSEPAKNRINFILNYKNKSEQALRLRNFRPVKNAAAVKPARDAYAAACKPAGDAYAAACNTARDAYDAAVKAASDAYDAACKPARDAYDAACKTASAPLRKRHRAEWPNNSWNGKSIFI